MAEPRRFVGPNGARFSVTPGVAVTQEYIDAKVAAGQWVPDDEQAAKAAPRRKAPAKPAAKAD